MTASAPDPHLHPSQLVFLHGAGLGPWVWESTRALLPYPSVALEVPSDRPDMDPQRAAAALLADPSFPERGPVVLVLHSLAGVLESALATSLGERLVHVVHVATVVPAPGKSFAATRGFAANLILRVLFRTHPEGLRPSPAMIQRELAADLDASSCATLVERFRPQQGGLFLEPVSARQTKVDSSYIVCGRDRSVAPALQRRIAARRGSRIEVLETGHLPMLAQPTLLAGVLSRIVG
ncbi:MAG TPA: alpha/beta hydrolase [Fibrobacteria bacterium]|nr:alpha/beta hydrolase [Fibrobacteria bacterium]